MMSIPQHPPLESYETHASRIQSTYTNSLKKQSCFSQFFSSASSSKSNSAESLEVAHADRSNNSNNNNNDSVEQKNSTRRLVLSVRDMKTPGNQIETSKYNLVTFLPKNLFVQLSKLAHVYFIIIGICQLFKAISTTNGTPAVFLPLLLITLVSMIKDFIEDRQRHAADKKENESKVLKLNPTTSVFEQVFWSTLRIGDIVKIEEDQPFPADLLSLQSSSQNGDLHVETKNLDGETNLKRKKVVSPTEFLGDSVLSYENLLKYQLKYEHPNAQMYSFSGVLNQNNNNSSGNTNLQSPTNQQQQQRSFAVGIDNICLRGSSLKMTKHLIGMVVYSGHETKILLNSQCSRLKKSRIESLLNKMILWIFILLLVVCTFSSTYYLIWYRKNKQQLTYLFFNENNFENTPTSSFFLMIPMWILLLGHFVPISLMVTLEMVKYFQGKILRHDKNYANINDDEFVDVKSCNLTEELGCIHYVFTDKTGTLTVNEMNFKAISLNSTPYLAEDAHLHDESVFYSQELAQTLFPQNLSKSIVQLPTKEMEGMNCLNVCHTIQVSEKNNKVHFSGVSPDEESIMEFCYKQGCYYAGEDVKEVLRVTCTASNQTLLFKRIALLDFDFVRRKMSVIVQDLQTKEYKLYCKGADQSIFDICQDSPRIAQTKQHLDMFASKGLRTLAFGYKILTQAQVTEFLNKLESIKQSVVDKDKAMFCLHQEIEQDLILLGGTGINDRLQADVQKTLKSLKAAGIKIWMLTGDKIETATNIACQCQLISLENTNLLLDSETTPDQALIAQIETFYLKAQQKQKYSVLVTGHTIYKIETLSKDHRHNTHNANQSDQQEPSKTISLLEKLHIVLFNSETVIASKITPKQKADLVNIVKSRDQSVGTLAIGDGANDVSMITTAHVGIGIRGKEGRQAAKVSDFSIGEFRHLNRLLLYQGYETYRKNSQLVFFNFYKNQIGFLVYFWYNFLCGQCGTFIYDQWVKQLFNLIFTALPIILYSIFDEIYPAHDCLQIVQTRPNRLESMPHMYSMQLMNPTFTVKNFWKSFLMGSFQSIIVALVGIMSMSESSHSSGRQISHMDVGMLIFTIAVVIPNLKVLQLHTTHYPFTLFFIFGSVGTLFIIFSISSRVKSLDSYGLMQSVFTSWNSYFAIALVSFVIFGTESAFQHWDRYSKAMKQPDELQSITTPPAIGDQSISDSPEKKRFTGTAIPKELHELQQKGATIEVDLKSTMRKDLEMNMIQIELV